MILSAGRSVCGNRGAFGNKQQDRDLHHVERSVIRWPETVLIQLKLKWLPSADRTTAVCCQDAGYCKRDTGSFSTRALPLRRSPDTSDRELVSLRRPTNVEVDHGAVFSIGKGALFGIVLDRRPSSSPLNATKIVRLFFFSLAKIRASSIMAEVPDALSSAP